MRKPFLTTLFGVALAANSAAQSPGFDCAKATTPQEKAICTSPELSKADAEMTSAYRAWLVAAPTDSQDAIRQNQRAWLRSRLSDCKPGDNATKFNQCLLDAEQRRTDELQGMVEHHNGILFVSHAIYLTAPDSPELAQMIKERGGETSGYVNASWPQAISSAPEWLAWNKAITDAAGPGNAFNDSKRTQQWSKENAVDNDTDVWVTLNSVSDHLVSAAIFGMTYGHGAAHPNHGVTQLNWMLKEQRPLQSSDIFKPQIYWSNELYNRVNQYLHKTLDADGESYDNWVNDPKGMQKTVRGIAADPTRWQIDNKGITIVFNPYEVACYACTPEPLTMSWQSLKPLLNPAFQIPR